MPSRLALEVMIPFLVGDLQGNFLASFAAGWACTTVSEGSADVVVLSVERFCRVLHLRLILWTRSGVV